MDYAARFIAYASAFERAFETDVWDEVAACFTPGAVYTVPFDPPLGGVFEGREAIVGYLKRILDGLDRCFETRAPELLALERGGRDGERIEIRGRVRYTHPEVPELVFELDEVAEFDGPLIARLEDRYDDDARARILYYVGTHGRRLGMLSPDPAPARS